MTTKKAFFKSSTSTAYSALRSQPASTRKKKRRRPHYNTSTRWYSHRLATTTPASNPSPSRSTSSPQDKFIASSCRCSSSVPVPYLQIDRVDLTFQATVTESRMNHDTRKLSLKAKYSAPGDSAEVSKETKAEYMNKRCIDINLSVTSADMPMGISKLLEIFNNQLVEVKPDEPEVLPEPTPAEKPKPTEQPTENKPATPTTPKPEKEEKKEEQKPEEPKIEDVMQPEMKYNILLLGKITNAQKSDILNIVSRYCRSSYKLSPSALNNIMKAKKHTIPVEDTPENVKTIIDALKQKKIAASAVEV